MDIISRLEHFLKYVDEHTYWKEDNDVPNELIVRAYIDKYGLNQLSEEEAQSARESDIDGDNLMDTMK
ncbi:MAG: hypothetical protein ABJH04_07550 [Cyclobacteriaceae bacterium]